MSQSSLRVALFGSARGTSIEYILNNESLSRFSIAYRCYR